MRVVKGIYRRMISNKFDTFCNMLCCNYLIVIVFIFEFLRYNNKCNFKIQFLGVNKTFFALLKLFIINSFYLLDLNNNNFSKTLTITKFIIKHSGHYLNNFNHQPHPV